MLVFVAKVFAWFTQVKLPSAMELGPPEGVTLDGLTKAIDASFDYSSNDPEGNDMGSHCSKVYKVDIRSGFSQSDLAIEDS